MKEAKIIRHHFEEYRAYLILNSVLRPASSAFQKKHLHKTAMQINFSCIFP